MEDEEVDLYADPRKGQSAYLPKELTEVRFPHIEAKREQRLTSYRRRLLKLPNRLL
jgi:hypothetical protein